MLIGGGLLLIMLLTGFSFWMVGYLRRRRIIRELAGDIAPQTIFRAQHSYMPVMLPGKSLEATQWLKEVLTEPSPVYSHWILSGPDGAGKTTVLTRFFHQNRHRLRPRWRMELLALGSPDALLRITRMPQRKNIILILDGLDDDPMLVENPVQRLDEIMKATQGFGRVVISCSAAAWPGGWNPAADGTSLRFTGQETSQLFGIAELPLPQQFKAPETLHAIIRNLAVAQSPHLASEVLSRGMASTQENGEPRLPESAARQFWWQIAEAMQLRARQGMGLTVKAFQLEELRERYADTWTTQALTQNFLWLDRVGRYRFVHGCLLSFFRAESIRRAESLTDEQIWRSLPRGAFFYQSLVWQEVQEEFEGDPWFYRTARSLERAPIQAIRPQQVIEISRLYLPGSAISQPPFFLPQLKNLKGLYLEGIARHQIPASWLSSLPDPQVQIYLTREQKIRQVLRFQATQHEEDLEPDESISVHALSLEPVLLREQPDPTRPIYNPRGHQRGEASLLHLLKLDVNRLLRQAEPKETGWVLDETLSLAEWGLFNRARAYRVPDGSFNLVMEQTIMSTLLVQELRVLINQLLAALGPDDEGLGTINPDDEAQLRDGHWMGRKWLWKAHDRYVNPVYLFADQPGCATMTIWGLSAP